MVFDKEFEIDTEKGRQPYYGVVCGGERVVIIKAGAGGDHRGYGDKYIKMARLLNRLSGCTVISASDPEGSNFLCTDVGFINWYLEGEGITPTAMHYIGSSRGATLGLTEAARCFTFESMLLINPPLMLNYHKTRTSLAALPEKTRVSFVFGERDPSFKYIPFLKSSLKESHRVIEFPGADHTFSGLTDEFVDLARLLFIEEK